MGMHFIFRSRPCNIDYYYHYYYKLTQIPNGELITISPKTQWGSESTGEKEIIDKKSEL